VLERCYTETETETETEAETEAENCTHKVRILRILVILTGERIERDFNGKETNQRNQGADYQDVQGRG